MGETENLRRLRRDLEREEGEPLELPHVIEGPNFYKARRSNRTEDSITDHAFFLGEEFDTQDEAECFGIRFGIDVIDGKVPNCSVR